MTAIRDSYLWALWTAFLSVYDQSLLHRALAACGRWCNEKIDRSVLLGLLCREGGFARAWDGSVLCRVLTFIANLPALLLHRLYAAFQPALDGSFFANLAFSVADETAVAQSWVIMLLWVIPFQRWNNAYNLLGFGCLLALFYVSGMRDKSRRVDVKAVGPYLIGLYFAAALSVVLSAYPGLSARFLMYHAVCLLCVLVTVSAVRSTADLLRLAAGGAFVVLVSGACGVLQRIQGVEVNESYVDVAVNAGMPGRVESFFDNPNTFAEVLILLLPIVLALFLCSKRLVSKAIAAGIFAIGAAALGMTYSRASWVGVACAMAVAVFLWKPKLIPLFIIGCVLAVPLLPDTILNRILTITNTNDSSTGDRVFIFQGAMNAIGASPVAGVGLGTAAPQKFISVNNLYHARAPYVHAHNIYVEVWLEMGLLGLVSFVGAMLLNIKNAARAVRHCPDAAARTITCACAAALCGAMVCGLADYLWNYPRVMAIFWFVFALCVAGTKLCRGAER